WVAALIYPDFNSFDDIGTAFYETAEIAGGPWLGVLTAIATALAWGIADALVAQVAISRVLFSMGRDRKLPKFLAKVHPKYKTPYASIIVVAIISLLVGLFFMGDIGILSSFINFGALTAFLFLHVSVFTHYVINNKSKNYWSHLILPLIGFIIIAYVWLNLATEAKTLGLSWLAIGIILAIYFAVKKKDASIDV